MMAEQEDSTLVGGVVSEMISASLCVPCGDMSAQEYLWRRAQIHGFEKVKPSDVEVGGERVVRIAPQPKMLTLVSSATARKDTARYVYENESDNACTSGRGFDSAGTADNASHGGRGGTGRTASVSELVDVVVDAYQATYFEMDVMLASYPDLTTKSEEKARKQKREFSTQTILRLVLEVLVLCSGIAAELIVTNSIDRIRRDVSLRARMRTIQDVITRDFESRVLQLAKQRVRPLLQRMKQVDATVETDAGAAMVPKCALFILRNRDLRQYDALLQLCERALIDLVRRNKLLLDSDALSKLSRMNLQPQRQATMQKPTVTTTAAAAEEEEEEEEEERTVSSTTAEKMAKEGMLVEEQFTASVFRIMRSFPESILDRDREEERKREQRQEERVQEAMDALPYMQLVRDGKINKNNQICQFCGLPGHRRRNCGIFGQLLRLVDEVIESEAEETRLNLHTDMTALVERIAASNARNPIREMNGGEGDELQVASTNVLDTICENTVSKMERLCTALLATRRDTQVPPSLDTNAGDARNTTYESAAIAAARNIGIDPAIIEHVHRRAFLLHTTSDNSG